jgi:hypothetical protein
LSHVKIDAVVTKVKLRFAWLFARIDGNNFKGFVFTGGRGETTTNFSRYDTPFIILIFFKSGAKFLFLLWLIMGKY